MSSYKIAVTGANGYIGSNLIYNLIENGLRPVVILRKDSKQRVPLGAEKKVGDTENVDFLNEAIRGTDIIFHLAGLKGYEVCGVDINKVIKTNINFTQKIVEAAKMNNVKIIFASTYWVYGHRAPLPYCESMALSPSEPYGWSKALAEKLIISSGINYNIVRLSNVFGYGKGIGYEEVTAIFLKKALEGKKIFLKNKGKNSVDLIYINDVCRALIDLFKINKKNLIINLGSGVPITILKLAKIVNLVSKTINNNQAILKRSEKQGDEILSVNRYMDTTKLKQLIGFVSTPIEIALEEFAKKLLNKSE